MGGGTGESRSRQTMGQDAVGQGGGRRRWEQEGMRWGRENRRGFSASGRCPPLGRARKSSSLFRSLRFTDSRAPARSGASSIRTSCRHRRRRRPRHHSLPHNVGGRMSLRMLDSHHVELTSTAAPRRARHSAAPPTRGCGQAGAGGPGRGSITQTTATRQHTVRTRHHSRAQPSCVRCYVFGDSSRRARTATAAARASDPERAPPRARPAAHCLPAASPRLSEASSSSMSEAKLSASVKPRGRGPVEHATCSAARAAVDACTRRGAGRAHCFASTTRSGEASALTRTSVERDALLTAGGRGGGGGRQADGSTCWSVTGRSSSMSRCCTRRGRRQAAERAA